MVEKNILKQLGNNCLSNKRQKNANRKGRWMYLPFISIVVDTDVNPMVALGKKDIVSQGEIPKSHNTNED